MDTDKLAAALGINMGDSSKEIREILLDHFCRQALLSMFMRFCQDQDDPQGFAENFINNWKAGQEKIIIEQLKNIRDARDDNFVSYLSEKNSAMTDSLDVNESITLSTKENLDETVYELKQLFKFDNNQDEPKY